LNLDLLRAITSFATGGLRPDMIVYLDIEAEEGLRRKEEAHRNSNAEWNRMDQKPLEFHQRVREGYLELANAEPRRWFMTNARLSPDEVQRAIRAQVDQFLSSKKMPENSMSTPRKERPER